jgi:hypothetical protein
MLELIADMGFLWFIASVVICVLFYALMKKYFLYLMIARSRFYI